MKTSECSKTDRPYVIGFDDTNKTGIVWRPNCKQWDCPYCGRTLANGWIHKIAYGVDWYMKNEPEYEWSFTTLTAHGKRRGMTKSLKDFRAAWPKVRLRIIHTWPGPLRYAAIPEQHEDGTVHIHMLINRRFDAKEYNKRDGGTAWRSRELARHLTACGLGWSHDTRPLRDAVGAANYASKYALKQAGQKDWPKGLRHVRTTHKWPFHDDFPGKKSDRVWITVKAEDIADRLLEYVLLGYSFE